MLARSIIRLIWMTSVIGMCAFFLLGAFIRSSLTSFLYIAALSVGLGVLIRISRAGTTAAAVVGTVFAACFASAHSSSGNILLHSAIPALCILFVLTTAATRFRRPQKLSLGLAESVSGRSAAQVVANLGAAAFFAVGSTLPDPKLQACGVAATIAALAEATADTVASEIGEAIPGRVVLVSTFRPVPPGTNGGVSLGGTVSGVLGAAVIVGVGALSMHLSARACCLAFGAALLGFYLDSVLGATVEDRGLLSNNQVNFLCTLTAASGAFVAVFLS